jgi:hypothetical protein
MARDRETMLRTIEDFEATLAEFQSNNVVLATTVLLRRLAEIEASAHELGDPFSPRWSKNYCDTLRPATFWTAETTRGRLTQLRFFPNNLTIAQVGVVAPHRGITL